MAWSKLVSSLMTSLLQLRPIADPAGLPATKSLPRSQPAGARQQHEDWDEYEEEDQDDDDVEPAAPANEDWRSMLQDITRYNPNRYGKHFNQVVRALHQRLILAAWDLHLLLLPCYDTCATNKSLSRQGSFLQVQIFKPWG